SSARSKWPYRRTTAPRTCGAYRRSRSSTRSRVTGAVLDVEVPDAFDDRPHVDVQPAGTLARAGAAGHPGGDLGSPVEAVAFDDGVPGEHLLGLRVRSVGHHRHAALHPVHPAGVGRRGQAAGVDELARLDQLLVPGG